MGAGGFLFAQSYRALPVQSWTGRNAFPTQRSFIRGDKLAPRLVAPASRWRSPYGAVPKLLIPREAMESNPLGVVYIQKRGI